jgi:hypothetical protein
MATLNEIAYNILNIARSGRSSDDDTLSINQIKHWVNYYRGTLLQKYTSNGRKIHPNCLQILIAPVVEAECDQGRIDQVPDVMSFAGQRAIERVETCYPNGWEFPTTITKTNAEELTLYIYYDATSLDLPTIKETYSSVVDWINTQKYNLDNPQLGLEGHRIKIAHHTICTSERWLDWATTSFTGRFNNACASGGAGTGRCGGVDTAVVGGNRTDLIGATGQETGNAGGYPGVALSSKTIDCDDTEEGNGGGIFDAVEWNRNGYGKVFMVQDWVQNSNDVTLNPPSNTVASGYNGNTMYQEPPKKATYYDGSTSFEHSSGYNERIVLGSDNDDGVVRVYENINGVWHLVGNPLTSTNTYENFGYSVDISKDGNIIAVGCPQQRGDSGEKGIVRLYKFQDDPGLPNPMTWVQMGTDITGQVDADNFGDSVALSRDGYRVAIAAPRHDSAKGTIQVYEYDPTAQNPTWTQMGSDIDGTTIAGGGGYGNVIAFAGYDSVTAKYGTTLAIGEPSSTNGTVDIYVWNGNTWFQTGPTLTGEASGDKFGFSVAFNELATRLVIGAPINDGGGTDKGEVYVYENQSGVWTQMGSDIAGETNSSQFGCSVDIDGEGNYIIAGSQDNPGGGTSRGSARVFKWDGTAWAQYGGDIDGEDNNDDSFAVSITDNGDIVALGSAYNDDGGANAGSVKMYKFNGTWNQIGNEINGVAGELLGWNLSLSNRSERDTIIFYDTEPGTYATDFATHTSPTLTDGPTTGSNSLYKISSSSEVWRRIGTGTVQGFGPPPAAAIEDNVVVLCFADEAADVGNQYATAHGGPYHTSFRPNNGSISQQMWEPPTAQSPQGNPIIMDSTLNNNFSNAHAGGSTTGSSITAPTYTSTSVNVWRYATDNGHSEQSSHDIASYTSQNTALTGYFNNATIADVHPSACWKADWIHHVETVNDHQGLFKAYLYPTRRQDPYTWLQYNAPFALHAAGAISSGDQTSPDGTYKHDGTTGTVPYCQVVDLSPLYYINPYYTTGYGALDTFGWSLNYEMGEFNSTKLQRDLDELLSTITWTEEIIPSNDGIDLCDCYEHIPTNVDRLRFQQFNRFTPGRAINGERIFRWYIEPQGFRYHDRISLILPDWNPSQSLAKIWAVFSNPEDIPGFDANFEYPFPDELISPLILEVLQKELNMTLVTSTDILNDGSGVAVTKPAASTKAKTKKRGK